MATLRRVTFKWDRSRHLLWACAETTEGATYRVGFPLAHVEILFCEELQKEGIEAGPRVGGYPDTASFCEWVDGLGRRYDGATVGACTPAVLGDADLVYYSDDELDPEVGKFRFGRKIKRAFKRTTKRIGRRAKGMLRRVGKLGRKPGKALGWAARSAAAAFPAVGGPALAALAAARSAVNTVGRARRIAQGARSAGVSAARGDVRRALLQGQQVMSQVQSLARQTTPQARLLQSALRSTAA